MTPLTRTSNVALTYGRRAVLEGVSLQVDPGMFIALIGRNGSGKSTLVRALAGLHRPAQGTIECNGRPLYGRGAPSATTRGQEIAAVLTDIPHTGYLTVRQVVNLGRIPYHPVALGPRPEDGAIVERASRETGIETIGDRIVDTLSDGQRQRVMVARALAQEPDLLLLDEPASFLDPPHQVDLFVRLGRLVHDRDRFAVVVATHSVQLALEFATHVWLIVDDTVVTGTPDMISDPDLMSAAFPHETIRYDPSLHRFRPV